MVHVFFKSTAKCHCYLCLPVTFLLVVSLCVGGIRLQAIRKADKSGKLCEDQDLGGRWTTLTSYIQSEEVLEDGGAFP